MNKIYGQDEGSSIPRYIGGFVFVVIFFLLGFNVGQNYKKTGEVVVVSNADDVEFLNDDSGEAVDLDIFWETWSVLSSNHVDPDKLMPQEMVYGAVKGMVGGIDDPYSVFMTPQENFEFNEAMAGHLEGIGAELTLRNGILTVVRPLKGSPAELAGLQPEDIIYLVDEEPTDRMTLDEAVSKIRGEKDSTVVLGVLRETAAEPLEISIVRGDINVNSVEWEMNGDIAIVEISQFGSTTIEEFQKTIGDVLIEQPEGMILDLRYNGGGYIGAAAEVSSEFLRDGIIVTVKERNPEMDEVWGVTGKGRIYDLPLVVLINESSASASEIVAGAIQDHERGTVIGEQSFGKGTVQSVIDLSGGASLRVTTARWYTPNDQNVHEEGITPDIVVEQTIEDFEQDRDPQLDEAIEFLKNA